VCQSTLGTIWLKHLLLSFRNSWRKRRFGWCCRRYDNKVMRLVPKRVLFYLFINYNMVAFKVHPSCACTHTHTLFSGPVTVCSIPGTHFVGCRLRLVLQHPGCLLLTQNGILSLPILLFEIKRSHKVRDQVRKEAAQPRIPL